MPKISVIVPVYKVEAYLDRCVQSILDQTYTDFELILVDDGSPDNCGAMCDAWAQKDSRIRVIHKENGGLSDARNVGFEASTGEWITFIDSDDYVHPKMVEALYDAVLEHDVKVSICGYAQTTGEPLEAVELTAKLWKSEDFYIQHNVNATVAWGKLYHRSIVLPYPKGKIHEDEYVTYRILFAMDQIAVVEAGLYGYFYNQLGITKSGWNKKHLDEVHAMEEQITFFQKNNYSMVCRKRIRDYIKTVVQNLVHINKQKTPRDYDSERKWLIKHGRYMIMRSVRYDVFSLEKDGWMLQHFYPRTILLNNLWICLRRKLRK